MALNKRRALGLAGMASMGLAGSMLVNACGQQDVQKEQCVSNEQFFKENIMPIAQSKCMACHTTSGQAKDTSLIFYDAGWGPDYIAHNMETFQQLSKLEFEGQPWILLKPTNQISHTGALQFDQNSDEYKAFSAMIDRLDNPVTCDEGDVVQEFFDNVELLDEVATLRKASLALVGRLPTLEEEQFVRDGGFDALDGVLDNMMKEDVFYDRLIEIYNDHFLTDRYYNDGRALDLLGGLSDDDDNPVYPDVYWFDAVYGDPQQMDLNDQQQKLHDQAADWSNWGLARESLELIAYVVKNDKPYTEVLTADYTMVNPYSAKSYGINPKFQDATDYNEYVPAKVPGIPHAGVLTNSVFMNRHPTTPTNRNRHRSRIIYEIFLATDVQRLGTRPVDGTKIQGFNPTMNDPNCTVCHSIIDPLAGSLQNWNDMGWYQPPVDGWYPDMRQPGFNDAVLPPEKTYSATSWVAGEIVKDNRFAIAPIHILFTGLSGQTPLQEPTDPKAEGYLEGIRAFDVQQKIFQDIADKFKASNFDLKVVVKELVKSPYYRASNAYDLDDTRELELKDVGTGRLLTPEQLDRKIEAITGQPWRDGGPDGDDFLLSMNEYRIFYGGIDSDEVVTRVTEPNGIMANTAARMSNEMACWTTAQDFAKDPSQRKLFPFVEPTMEPQDANGFEVATASQAIRANIQYLHQHMLGEFLSVNDPEIDRTYRLFIDLWQDGLSGMAAAADDPNGPGEYPTGLGSCGATTDYWTGQDLGERSITDDPNYTIRAWMGVMTYLLQDYRFLHE